MDIQPIELFSIGNFKITNTITSGILDFIFILLICFVISKFTIRPNSKIQLVIESLFEFLVNFINKIIQDTNKSKKILPLIVILVFYIISINLINLLFPVLASFTYNDKPMFRTLTSDFNATFAIAIMMLSFVQLQKIMKLGILKYIFSFFQIPQLINGLLQGYKKFFLALINSFIGILDLISEFAKVASLSLRLFGNMLAGEVLLSVFAKIMPLFIPLPIILLGILSGSVQSIVFGALVTSYLISSES